MRINKCERDMARGEFNKNYFIFIVFYSEAVATFSKNVNKSVDIYKSHNTMNRFMQFNSYNT